MEVRIREQRLPGIGYCFVLALTGGQSLSIVVQHDGGRQIGVHGGGTEGDQSAVALTQDEAMAVAAILTGARFTIDTANDPHVDADEVAVDTVELGPRSPAVGRRLEDVPLLEDIDAAVLAVIRDETPELVEDPDAMPCQVGDRVVVAARRDRLDELTRMLAG